MDFSKAKIAKIIIHEIGNKLRNEGVFLSESLQNIDEQLECVLTNYFFKSFITKNDYYTFSHKDNLKFNELYSYSQDIFKTKNTDKFIISSNKIAQHLYEYTLHPKITKGELIIIQVSDILINNTLVEGLGIFKSENKDSFIKVLKDNKAISLKDDKGINISKIEKGCFIFNINEAQGYSILNIDSQSQVTDYWANKFLGISNLVNDEYKTKEIINICKNFSNEILSTKYDKEVEINFNNDFINYFEDSDSFDINEFKENVLSNEKIKENFFSYKEDNNYSNFDINEKFLLSEREVKKEKRKIKNIIKLDTKMELNVLIDKEQGTKNIEKGFDDKKGMYFYKIYFNEEIN